MNLRDNQPKSAMMTLELIRKPVAGDLEAYEAFVTRHFHAESDLLSQMLR